MTLYSILKISRWLLAVIGFFTLYSCETKYREVIHSENSEFTLRIEAGKQGRFVNKMHQFSPDEIIMENTTLKEGLSILLQKDTTLIYFEDKRKEDIVLIAEYRNLRENAHISESLAEFLSQLKEGLHFSLVEEVPEKTYQLTIYDTILLAQNISKEQNQDKSTVFNSPSKEITRFTNTSISQITEGFNKTYNSNIVSGDNMSDFTKYSFEVDEIPFEDLKIYLEKNIGLSLVNYNESGFEADFQTATKVVFND